MQTESTTCRDYTIHSTCLKQFKDIRLIHTKVNVRVNTPELDITRIDSKNQTWKVSQIWNGRNFNASVKLPKGKNCEALNFPRENFSLLWNKGNIILFQKEFQRGLVGLQIAQIMFFSIGLLTNFWFGRILRWNIPLKRWAFSSNRCVYSIFSWEDP